MEPYSQVLNKCWD